MPIIASKESNMSHIVDAFKNARRQQARELVSVLPILTSLQSLQELTFSEPETAPSKELVKRQTTLKPKPLITNFPQRNIRNLLLIPTLAAVGSAILQTIVTQTPNPYHGHP